MHSMKKLFTLISLLVVLLLTSCSKEITYTVTNNTGSSYTLYIHECTNDGTSVNIQTAAFVDGETRTFTANEKATALRFYILELECWVQQAYFLDQQKDITIDGYTIVGSSRP